MCAGVSLAEGSEGVGMGLFQRDVGIKGWTGAMRGDKRDLGAEGEVDGWRQA